MTLPSDLLQAVAATGGGKITLVVGAGCSFEIPTSIPLAATCSSECHDRLVANGVLAPGDCPIPSNLSCLADTIVKKSGKQQLLVDQLLQHYPLKTATPNEGHLLTAALLSEGTIASVLTLNFDLALSIAIGQLGVGDNIGIIEGPDNLHDQKLINLYYLHRNVNAVDPDTWILRTEALTSEWQGQWESIIATKVLSTPVVVFAGLGSPADVLIESIKLIQKAIPNGHKVYQVDPGDYNQLDFFKALALDPSAFINAKWCDFMFTLSQRLVVEHISKLKAAADTIVMRDNLSHEDITSLLKRFEEIGLVKLGSLRANWLLHDKPYSPEEQIARELIADLLLAAAMVERVTGAIAIAFDDGIVEFQKSGRTVSSYMFISGRGSRSRIAIEGELSLRQRRFRGRASAPTGAIIAGTRDNTTTISAPKDLLLGETSESILFGQTQLPIFSVESLRQNPALCKEVAP